MIHDMHMMQLESEAYVLYPDGNQYAYTPNYVALENNDVASYSYI